MIHWNKPKCKKNLSKRYKKICVGHSKHGQKPIAFSKQQCDPKKCTKNSISKVSWRQHSSEIWGFHQKLLGQNWSQEAEPIHYHSSQ